MESVEKGIELTYEDFMEWGLEDGIRKDVLEKIWEAGPSPVIHTRAKDRVSLRRIIRAVNSLYLYTTPEDGQNGS